jgi:antagonist of KipI
MSVRVLRPGLLTTVQDLGRPGYQRFGVVVGGAMDRLSLRVANLLVGNDEGAAALEITLLGPTLAFDEDAILALCGGEWSPRLDGCPLPMWRPICIQRGSVLTFGSPHSGCRAYLAIAGGFDVPQVMGSRSTYLRAGIGGYQGRALATDDILNVTSPKRERGPDALSQGQPRSSLALWSSEGNDTFYPVWSAGIRPRYSEHATIRVVRGREFDWFTAASREQCFSQEYTVTPQSDRMGYRLQGTPLQLVSPREMISEAVCCGTIQVPADGQPILLMADCATTGGYPRVAHVIAADLPLAAQLKPGDKMRFQEVSLAEARQLHLKQEANLAKLRVGLRFKQDSVS